MQDMNIKKLTDEANAILFALIQKYHPQQCGAIIAMITGGFLGCIDDSDDRLNQMTEFMQEIVANTMSETKDRLINNKKGMN